jgi:hypothetical protein
MSTRHPGGFSVGFHPDEGLTVLEFTRIRFIGKWTRSPGASFAAYVAEEEASTNLAVESEGETGNVVSHLFTIAPGKEVWVDLGQNIVHVPALSTQLPVIMNGWG